MSLSHAYILPHWKGTAQMFELKYWHSLSLSCLVCVILLVMCGREACCRPGSCLPLPGRMSWSSPSWSMPAMYTSQHSVSRKLQAKTMPSTLVVFWILMVVRRTQKRFPRCQMHFQPPSELAKACNWICVALQIACSSVRIWLHEVVLQGKFLICHNAVRGQQVRFRKWCRGRYVRCSFLQGILQWASTKYSTIWNTPIAAHINIQESVIAVNQCH